jgi:REP element-mobilizing transposase RayT
MQLNDAGRMVCQWYTELENKFPDIQCDEFVCMPNHVHFVVVNVGVGIDVGVNVGADLRVCPGSMPPPGEHGGMGEQHGGMGEHIGSPIRGVIQWFKTMTTNGYIRGVKQNGWPPFPGKLWQRNYWEHIVRSETEMRRIRQYIRNNPENWDSDTFRVVRCQGNT